MTALRDPNPFFFAAPAPTPNGHGCSPGSCCICSPVFRGLDLEEETPEGDGVSDDEGEAKREEEAKGLEEEETGGLIVVVEVVFAVEVVDEETLLFMPSPCFSFGPGLLESPLTGDLASNVLDPDGFIRDVPGLC